MADMPIPGEIEHLSDMLFQRFRSSNHRIAKLADWTLNLTAKISIPPPKLPGYTVTNYCHFDPKKEEDLKAICRDFVRSAVYSVRRTKKLNELKITTMEAENG
ncbi:MAG: hypothetical protein IKO93_08625 [Lentisphaeria bacterium]|nr:hypothetical protein [Lentisphaeria bacterium]